MSLVIIDPLHPMIIKAIKEAGLDERMLLTGAGILAFLIGITASDRAGALLDHRVFERLYGPGGIWIRETNPQFLFFPPGHDIDGWRTRARKELASRDEKYANPDVSIYQEVIDSLRQQASDDHRAVMQDLEWSKAARDAMLPTAFVALYAMTQQSLLLAIVLFLITCTFFIPFVRLRALHLSKMYRRYCSVIGVSPGTQ